MENMENSPCRSLVPFTSGEMTVRAMELDGQAWFVAKDVAVAMGYVEHEKAIRTHCKGCPKWTPLQTAGGIQQIRVISQSDVLRLIVSSHLPQAVEFERWVFEDVLPAVMKHGVYAVDRLINDPDTLIRALERYRDERLARLEAESRRNALAAQVEADRPKVLFSDAVSASPTTILVGDLAKFLYQNGVKTGQKRLFAWMRENGYLIRQHGTSRNMPTQWAMELGLFEIQETAIHHSNGHITIQRTVKVTGKGQQYFIHRFLG